jgi:hypothetical protein
MKKTLFLLLFLIPILRGSLLTAQQLQITATFTLTDTSFCNDKYRIVSVATGGTQPYSFRLDSTIASSTGIFENVLGGNHFVDVTDATGQQRRVSIVVPTNNSLNVFLPDSCSNNAGVGRLKAVVTGGQPPYTYVWSNGLTGTVSNVNLQLGLYSITVTDSRNCTAVKSARVLNCSSNLLLNTSYISIDSGCALKYRFIMSASGGTAPYTYRLDSFRTSTTGIFEDVYGGNHIIDLTDATGRQQRFFTTLPTSTANLRAYFSYGTITCDNPGVAIYSLNVVGGHPPFRFFIGNDTVGTTVNSFQLNPNSLYNVFIRDAQGCSFNDSVRAPQALRNEYLYATADFTPTNCGDTIGKIKIKISTNLRLTTPLSMSFDNRPFTTDSVFTNVKANNSYPIKVKTQNCGEQSTTFYVGLKGPIRNVQSYFIMKNCAAQTGDLEIWANGGVSPFRISIDGQAEQTYDSITVFLQNVRAGSSHTIRIRSAEGCEVTQTVVAKDVLNPQYSYLTNCGQTSNLTISGNRSGKIYQLDNQPILRDTGFYLVWQNVAQGKHIFRLIDSTGCTRTDTITLYGQGLNVGSVRSNGNCTDTTARLTVSGGVPPYTFVFNYGAPTTVNDFKLRVGSSYSVEVTDANFCRFRGYVYPKAEDSVTINASISSLSCSTGNVTVGITVRDTNAAIPIMLSFDGRPFSTDTVFRNVQTGRSYNILVKSKQGCDLKATIYVYGGNSSVPVYAFVRDTCINRAGLARLRPTVFSGLGPFTYAWNTGDTTIAINAPVGLYTVTVTDANNCQSIASGRIWSCVWAGDTDTSGVVDNRDLLNIGLAFGETGQRRCIYDSLPNTLLCINWFGQKAAEWSKQTPDRTNFKHVDTNGDAVINAADTVAITRNWSLSHQSIEPQTPGFAAQNAVPPIFVQTSNVREGDWASFPIVLGEAGLQADNVYGLAFSIKYPPSVIEPNTMRLVVNQSWLDAPASLLNVFKDEFDNVCHIGLVKTNKLNSTGTGQIATLVFKLKAGTKGNDLQFGVYNDFLINNAGQQLPSVGRTTSIKILTGTAEPIWANQISVYPNPTTDKVTIDAQNLVIQRVTVLDIAGKEIQKVSENAPLPIVSGSTISIGMSGTYFLKIETDKGIIVKKIVKM